MFNKKKKQDKLGIKIGTPEQAFWNSRKVQMEQTIKAMEEDLIALPKLIAFNKEILALLKKKLK